YWQKAQVFCDLEAGDRAGAELGLALVRDLERSEDRVFVRLADAALDLAPMGSGDLARLDAAHLEPLEMALLGDLERTLPPALMSAAPPRAKLHLVLNDRFALADRTAAAEWAVTSG